MGPLRTGLALAVTVLALGCGYSPHPKNGALPCASQCPSGYVCRADNHCWINEPVDAVTPGDGNSGDGNSSDGKAPADAAATDGDATIKDPDPDPNDRDGPVVDGPAEDADSRFDQSAVADGSDQADHASDAGSDAAADLALTDMKMNPDLPASSDLPAMVDLPPADVPNPDLPASTDLPAPVDVPPADLSNPDLPKICTPDRPACNSAIATTCNADGTGYLPGGTNCAALGQICSSGACKSSGVDTLEADPPATMTKGTVNTQTLKLNVYSTSSARSLRRIEEFLEVTAPVTLTWVVYESDTTATGIFDLISSTTTTATVGTGYQSSGTLSVSLRTGNFYAIGVGWGTTPTGYWYYSASTSPYPKAVAFGNLISAAGYTFSSSSPPVSIIDPVGNGYFPQRLTSQ